MENKLKKVIFYNSALLNIIPLGISVIALADLDRDQFVGERLNLIYENIKTTLTYGQPT